MSNSHYSEWGKVDLLTAKWWSQDPTRLYQIKKYAVWYDPDTLSVSSLRSRLPTEASDFRHASPPSMATFRVTGHEVQELAFLDGILTVTRAAESTANLGNLPPAESVAGYTNSRSVYNDAGKYANDVKVGIIEGLNQDCGLFEEHEAFSEATFEYLSKPISCTSDSECNNNGCGIGISGYCRGGTCDAAAHATGVASRISSSTDEELLHAAKVEFVIANTSPSSTTPVGLLKAYRALFEKNVQIVNESWGLADGDEDAFATDYLRDWYARYRNILSVKASGNSPDTEVLCDSLNALCVGGTDANQTYSTIGDDKFAGTSFQNPHFASSHPKKSAEDAKDAERPDVVSEAASVWGTDFFGGPTDWIKMDGKSSYATANVTGLAALFKADCNINSQEMYRAVFRTAAFRRHSVEDNSSDPRYPIPGQSPDSRAGAGIVLAEALTWFCNENSGGADARMGQGEINTQTDDGWDDIPSFMTSGEFPNTNEGEIVTHQQALRQPDDVATPLWGIEEGTNRVRVTFTYNTCPNTSESGDAFGTSESSNEDVRNQIHSNVNMLVPVVDFDLALCSEELASCIAVSDSRDDTNEGFDMTVPQEFQAVDDLVVYLIKPNAEDAALCNGSGNEPWASAIITWG